MVPKQPGDKAVLEIEDVHFQLNNQISLEIFLTLSSSTLGTLIAFLTA
jgi:hypothetical protein